MVLTVAATKLSKRAKKAAREAVEERTRAKEEEALRNDAPQTAEAFDRALMATPNSSMLWVKYIAFHLQVWSSPPPPSPRQCFPAAISCYF